MNPREQMAVDDLFFSAVLLAIGLYASYLNVIEGDWWGLLGTTLLSAFAGLWLSARIYHLMHRDEILRDDRYGRSE